MEEIDLYGYVYLTYCKINGKIYIGQRKYNKFDTKYYGSGKLIIKALEKYGVDNFEVRIIEWCSSFEELNNRERFWIRKYNSRKRDIGYNLAEGGVWGKCNISNKTRQKLSKANKGKKISLETRKRISEAKRGVPLSLELRQKLSNAKIGKPGNNAGKICIQKEDIRKYIDSKELNKYLNDGWARGNRKSAQHIKAVTESEINFYKISTFDGNDILVRGLSNIENTLKSYFGISIGGSYIKMLIRTGKKYEPKHTKYKILKNIKISKVNKKEVVFENGTYRIRD